MGRIVRLLAAAGACAATVLTAVAVPSGAAGADSTSPASICPDAGHGPFGGNVCVFSDTMPQARIQADLNAIATAQVPVSSQFGTARYSVFFEPGTYGSAADPLVFQVGYYTQVAGLGALPDDTVINGAIDVFNNLCDGKGDCNADVNFWRSLSNLKLNVDLPSSAPAYAPAPGDPYGAGCDNSAEMWAVSQAAPMRRVDVNGSIVFQDYCAANNYASGGYIADSAISGGFDTYGNQQYFVRESSIGAANGCPGGLWNNVYSGVKGAPAAAFSGTCHQNTVLASSPVTAEEPFLFTDASGNYRVFEPAVRHGSSGTSWASGGEAGTSLPLSSFFIANPSTSVASINAALAAGQNLVLTPGVYHVDQPIRVTRPGTVVLGQGFATLIPDRGTEALTVVPDSGVKVSGLLIDAGPVNSPALMTVGTPGGQDPNAAGDPDLIQDVFFRIGGAATTATSATVSLTDNASHSIIDDVWAWRADHGNDVGWTKNTGDTGLAVTGDDVTAYGLAVEHYQKSEVNWTGQGGTVEFFQNEMPYDPPAQSAWNESSTFSGYPAFRVGAGVKTFHGYGMGSYVVFNQTSATLHVTSAFQGPSATAAPGVKWNNVFGVWITGSGGDDSVINGTGGPVTSASPGTVEPVDVTSYP